MMRLSTLLICVPGAAITWVVADAANPLLGLMCGVALAFTTSFAYHEGRRDGIKEACDYVEKFAKAQKDRS